MSKIRKVWLVHNAGSGSNTEEALEMLEHCCGRSGFHIARSSKFPEQDAPTPAELAAAGIELLAVFAGDGTINAVVTGLYGWDGSILALPGGTMNLLCKRLHGDADFEQIVDLAAVGRCRIVRPAIARTAHGDALAELLAGPGTAWNEVREAMRKKDMAGVVDGAAEALEETTAGSTIVCEEPELGAPEGYPLLMLTPAENTIAVDAYHAETTGEFVQQSLALLKRNFRDGPHEPLGSVETLAIRDSAERGIGLLIDGEPFEGQSRETFRVAKCEVDLVATAHG